jgi:hypothetical protein
MHHFKSWETIMAEQGEDKKWPPPEIADDKAIIHIEEGARGSTLLGSGDRPVASKNDG